MTTLAEQIFNSASEQVKKQNNLKAEVLRMYAAGVKPKQILVSVKSRGFKNTEGREPSLGLINQYIYQYRKDNGMNRNQKPKRSVVKQTTYVTKSFDAMLTELVEKKVEAALKKALRGLAD